MQKKRPYPAVCLLLMLAPLAVFSQGQTEYIEYTIDDFLREGFTYDQIEEAQHQAAASANVSPAESVIASSSRIDWSRQTFVSDVSLDVVKAGIPMPSGKTVSLNRIDMELPILIKDPLLSLYVDDTRTLGDLVLDGTVTLEALTRIVDGSAQTPAYFVDGSHNLKTTHTIRLQDIGALLVRHHVPYVLEKPIDRISSRAYTGIVIDARGILPVQGEFSSSQLEPCLFPRVWNEDMTLVYERNMVDPEVVKQSGIIDYMRAQGTSKRTQRAGRDPLWITAKKVYGVNRCDPVISYDDYLRIATIPANLELLRQGKVVILVDDDRLAHSVSAPRKDVRYYIDYQAVKERLTGVDIPDLTVDDTPSGFTFQMLNLRFIADSAELLPEERPRVAIIAEQIKMLLQKSEHTIRVDGHTADVNKPNGQQALSLQRAEAVVNALVEEGIDRSLITWFGYGGTKPIADNATAAGRAQNRRVEITVMPKGTDVQRR